MARVPKLGVDNPDAALCIHCHQPIRFEFGQWKHVYADWITSLCWMEAIDLERGFSRFPIESEQAITFMPANSHGIREGYYTGYGIVRLLREHKDSPEAIQFIADMLE
jgi:hypothetical protein